MGEGRRDPRLPNEHVPEARILRKAGVNHLYGDFLLETLHSPHPAQIHLGHSAGGDFPDDDILIGETREQPSTSSRFPP
jgi:hypothetical protein